MPPPSAFLPAALSCSPIEGGLASLPFLALVVGEGVFRAGEDFRAGEVFRAGEGDLREGVRRVATIDREWQKARNRPARFEMEKRHSRFPFLLSVAVKVEASEASQPGGLRRSCLWQVEHERPLESSGAERVWRRPLALPHSKMASRRKTPKHAAVIRFCG